MPIPTINHQAVVDRFERLLDDKDVRLLRLVGDEKMGKSHLVAERFPARLEQRRTPFALLDLRTEAIGILDLLGQIVGALGNTIAFDNYKAARAHLVTPREVNIKGVVQLFSSLHADVPELDQWEIGRQLTVQVAADVRDAGVPVVLLVDTVERASESTKAWLMSSLLIELCRLANVRTVIAGRSLPPSNNSYRRHAVELELRCVEDRAAYVAYCEKARLSCSAEQAGDFARLLRYTPGLFVDYVVSAFPPREDGA